MSAAPPVLKVASAEPGAPAASAAEVARAMRHKRARRLFRNFALWVGVPTLLGALYYGMVARDEYESVATVLVRGTDANVAQRESMLREYLLSRDMLDTLEQRGFSAHYQTHGDLFSRLHSGAGSEARYAYFRRHVSADYDTQSHVFTLHVRAFSGGEAARFAREMLALGRAFLTQVEQQAGTLAPGAAPATLLVTIASPSSPNEATQPRRIYAIVTVFFASLALFGIGSLLLAAVREHAQF